jgi:predicted kinase
MAEQQEQPAMVLLEDLVMQALSVLPAERAEPAQLHTAEASQGSIPQTLRAATMHPDR